MISFVPLFCVFVVVVCFLWSLFRTFFAECRRNHCDKNRYPERKGQIVKWHTVSVYIFLNVWYFGSYGFKFKINRFSYWDCYEHQGNLISWYILQTTFEAKNTNIGNEFFFPGSAECRTTPVYHRPYRISSALPFRSWPEESHLPQVLR